MAKIVISMSGEGRGHATRVRAVVEALRREHQILLQAPGDAFTFLWPLYAASEVAVERLPGLRFAYDARHRLKYFGTLRQVLAYLRELPALVAQLEQRLRRERPDLTIADFEPALPRAARRAGVPLISLDHQHFLRTYDLGSLPPRLRLHARYMGWIVGAYCAGQVETIVSSFYFPPLRADARGVTQVGVLIRPEVATTRATEGQHLTAYWRRHVSPRVLEALAATGRDVRVYGLGARAAEGRLTFHAISESRFIDDLASCAALVSTAGNQLVGEALHFGKPVFALPETNNFEQEINAHFLRRSGAGDAVAMHRFRPGHLRDFLERLDEHRRCIPADRINGLPAVLEVLRRHLPGTRFEKQPAHRLVA